MNQSNDPKKNASSEYKKVARRLHEAFQNNAKKYTTIRGSAFNADFAGDDPTSNASKTEGRDKSCSQKRAKTIIKKGLFFFKKLKNPKCLAYSIKDYIFSNC